MPTLQEMIAMGDTSWLPRGINVEELEKQEDELVKRLGVVRTVLSALREGGVAAERKKRRRKGDTRLAQIIRVLKDEGRPLPVMAIYRRLQAIDPLLKWKQPQAAFRSYLREQTGEEPDAVVRTSRGVYGLKQWGENPPGRQPTEDASERTPLDELLDKATQA